VNPQSYWTQVGGEGGIAEAFVYDGSYIRLREVALSYTIPARLLGATPVRGANVTLAGRNLGFLRKNTPGFDPESGYNTTLEAQGREAFAFPTTRNIGFTLNLTF
jgi:hypothetical protein